MYLAIVGVALAIYLLIGFVFASWCYINNKFNIDRGRKSDLVFFMVSWIFFVFIYTMIAIEVVWQSYLDKWSKK